MKKKVDDFESQSESVDEEERLRELIDLAFRYRCSNPEKTEQLSREVLARAQEISSRPLIARAYSTLGTSFSARSDYEKATEFAKQSLKIQIEDQNEDGIATSLHNIGFILWKQAKIDEALEKYYQAAAIFEKIGSRKNLANSYTNIGIIFFDRKVHKHALRYAHNALSIYQELEDQNGVGSTYNNMGMIYEDQEDYDNALTHYINAEEIFTNTDNTEFLGNVYANQGSVYMKLESLDKALEYYNKSLKKRESMSDQHGIASSYLDIGLAYSHMDNFDKAFHFLNEGLAIAQKVGANKKVLSFCKTLAELHEKQGCHEEALEYFKQYSKTREEIYSEKSANKIAELQAEHETNKQKQELIEMKYKFISLASHELRTPLTILMGHHQLIQKEHLRRHPDASQKRFEIVNNTFERLARIVDNLTKSFQLDLKDLEITKENHSMNQLVQDLEREVQPFIEQRNLTLETLIPDKEINLSVNRDLIWQAVMNLLLNAIRFTKDQGKITIKLAEKEGNVKIQVADTGIGIPKDELEKIFSSFYKTADVDYHSTGFTEFGSGGIGLGLSIAQAATRIHGGKISVESEQDKGSVFTISIPSLSIEDSQKSEAGEG